MLIVLQHEAGGVGRSGSGRRSLDGETIERRQYEPSMPPNSPPATARPAAPPAYSPANPALNQNKSPRNKSRYAGFFVSIGALPVRDISLRLIGTQHFQHSRQGMPQALNIHQAAPNGGHRRRSPHFGLISFNRGRSTCAMPQLIQPIPRAIDRETLLVQQLANTPDQQHFMMLVVAPIAASLDRLELRELLLPIAQHVRLDGAQVAHLTNGEVAFGWNRRQVDPLRVFIGGHTGLNYRAGERDGLNGRLNEITQQN